MSEFEGYTALVTGASRGIGRALAIEMGARGARVVCAARATNENRLKLPGTIDETVEQIVSNGGEGLAVPTDLSKSDEVSTMIDATVSHFGGLDILVNNAAVTFAGDIEIQPKHYQLIMDINVKAPMQASLYARSWLAKSQNGRILNVSSAASMNYFPSMMSYGMSKAALDHLSVSTAAQFQSDKIAVNCFRIDASVATEGYMLNAPDEDFSNWAKPDSAVALMCWMLEQPSEYTGRVEDMTVLNERLNLVDAFGKGAPTADLKSPWPVFKAPDF